MLIPSLTSEAGSVLTVADWVSIDVKLASCDLSALLVKPGLAVLKQLDGLKSYWNWPGELVLNVLSLPCNTSGQCIIRSNFDGSLLRFEQEEILELIDQLKPDYVALPSGILPKLLEHDETVYSAGDKPGQDALQGLIYTSNKEKRYLITDKSCALSFYKMDENCACPACADGFTRAYFHHLYQHTPLLCQRWLVMHNQWIMGHVLF